jgi:hypothetical protein
MVAGMQRILILIGEYYCSLELQISSLNHPQPINDGDKSNRFIAAGNYKSQSAPIAWLRAPQSRNNPLQQRFSNVAQRTNDME